MTKAADLAKFIAKKGSITLNGTSLTVNQVTASSFDINVLDSRTESAKAPIINCIVLIESSFAGIG